MTDPLFEADDEANTPLTPEGRQGLIPTYITTRAELNEAEQENIAEADRWAFSRKRGDAVDVIGPDGSTIARGVSAYSSEDATRLIGHKSDAFEAILGYRGRPALIHVDDMVLVG